MSGMKCLWEVSVAERGTESILDRVKVVAPTVEAASKRAAAWFRANGHTRFVVRTVEWKGRVLP